MSNNSQKLLEACRNGAIEEAKELLRDPDIDVNIRNERGSTPIVLAFRASITTPEIAKIMIKDKRVDVLAPDASEEIPIWIWFHHFEDLELLLIYKNIPPVVPPYVWKNVLFTRNETYLLREYEKDHAKTRRRLRNKHRIGHGDAANLFLMTLMIE